MNAPLVGIYTSSTRFDDKALQLACKATLTNLREQAGGGYDIKAVYIDNPHRDGLGAKRLFELAGGSGGGCIVTSVPRHCILFDRSSWHIRYIFENVNVI